jgi:hypothetical protein
MMMEKMKMADLAQQFADIIGKGDPHFASSLADALNSSGGDNASSGADQTKAEANYQSTSDDPSKSCSSCKHFQSPKSCEVVSGTISPNGISDNYEAKHGADTGSTTTDSGPSTSGSSGDSGSSSSSDSSSKDSASADTQSQG